MHGLNIFNFNLLLSIRNYMLTNNLNFNDLKIIFNSKINMYRQGYTDCIGDFRKAVVEKLTMYMSMEKLNEEDVFFISSSIEAELLYQLETKILKLII